MFTGVEIYDTSLLDQTITLDITLTNVPRSYTHRYQPVQICVNAINIQSNLLMILVAHYQTAISQLFIRLFRNIKVFCFSCHRQNIPVSLGVILKAHKHQHVSGSHLQPM